MRSYIPCWVKVKTTKEKVLMFANLYLFNSAYKINLGVSGNRSSINGSCCWSGWHNAYRTQDSVLLLLEEYEKGKQKEKTRLHSMYEIYM